MRTFKLRNGDLCLVCGVGLGIIEGREAVAQSATNYARTLRGEMMHKKRSGVRFFQTVIGVNPPRAALFEHDVKERLLEVPGARRVSSFQSEVVDGQFHYRAVVETDLGLVEVNG